MRYVIVLLMLSGCASVGSYGDAAEYCDEVSRIAVDVKRDKFEVICK